MSNDQRAIALRGLGRARRAWRTAQIGPATQLATAFVAGAVAGLVLGSRASVLQPLGDLFLAALQAVGPPVALCALLSALALFSAQRLTRLGLTSLGWYLGTALIASLVAVLVADALSIGAGFDSAAAAGASAPATTPSRAGLEGFRSALHGPLPHVVVWTLALALLAGRMRRAEPAGLRPRWARLLDDATVVFYRLLNWVMLFAPVGVFALIAVALAQMRMVGAAQLVTVLVAVYLTQIIVCMGCGLVIWRTSLGLRNFLCGAAEALMTAFATGSSAATMPVEFAVAEQKLGSERKLVGVVLPLGLAIHKLGSAAFLGVVLVFAANASGTELTPPTLLWLASLTLAASVITPPVSGGTLAALAIVASDSSLPMAAITIAATIPLLGKLNTPINSLGRLMSVVTISERPTLHQEPRTE